MASCTTVYRPLTDKTNQFYYHSYLPKLRDVYHLTLNKFLNVDITDRYQLVERLARSLSVEGIMPISTPVKQYSRTISVFVQQSEIQTQFDEDKENEFEFEAIIDDNDKRHYSTKQPYKSPSQDCSLSTPPSGYKPIGVQLLARHGSRSLNGHDYDIETLKIWQLAKDKNMLTSLGKQLENDVKSFMNANNTVGRGELTEVGKEEHFQLGNRLYNRLKSLFIESSTISVVTSGKKRAVDSADEFLNGLKACECNIEVLKSNPDKQLLYFHKSCTNYMTFKKNDENVKTKLNSIKYSQQTRQYAQQVLKRIFKKDFVDLLINGNYENLEPTEKKKNEVDIVLSLFSMFVVSPAQKEPQLANMLAKYFNQEESKWFAYVADAQEFYLKGPSIEGTSITFDMAKPLLADFFSSITACIETNNKTAVNLRFAHAETIIPFATLLKIPGLSDQATHSLDIYTYENNQWRGDKVAPMAANIQWEIYQHETNTNEILIRMLYNETEIRFKEDCKSITPESYFYDFNELKRAYADLLKPSN